MKFVFCFVVRLRVCSEDIFWFITVESRREDVVGVNACVMGWIVIEWLNLCRIELVHKRTFLSIGHDFVVKGFL